MRCYNRIPISDCVIGHHPLLKQDGSTKEHDEFDPVAPLGTTTISRFRNPRVQLGPAVPFGEGRERPWERK